MTAYAADPDTGAPLCADCAVVACRCVADRDDTAARARELDDRDPDKLAVVAAELAAERLGCLRDLTAERFWGGWR